MCGIAGHLGRVDPRAGRRLLGAMPWRGPDGDGVAAVPGAVLAQNRLAIIDVAGGRQPIANEDESGWLVFNGELYNHQALRRTLTGHQWRTRTDAEVVLHLYEDEGPAMLTRLRGMYAFAIWDRQGHLFLARDPIGIKPLYWGRDAGGRLVFASEIKALLAVTRDIAEFPPGHYYRSDTGLVRFYDLPPATRPVSDPDVAVRLIRHELFGAVKSCLLTSDVPVGTFLSGGLDSSLVSAMARRIHGPGLLSFGVGMVGSADLEWARRAAAYLGTHHHEYAYTPAEVQAVLPAVIYHLESFDVPLVRSAVATYFVSQLAARHVKVVLTGEGADELFAGYHYLKTLPDSAALDDECRRITSTLHNTNLQRADRQSMAHGLEARVPFLELPVVEAALAIDPAIKLGPDGTSEKWLLRRAAAAYLPGEIVWRGKEKFSLGTGTGQYLEQWAAESVSDAEFQAERDLDCGVRLHTKEELLYCRLFRRHYDVPGLIAGMGRSRTVGNYDLNLAAV